MLASVPKLVEFVFFDLSCFAWRQFCDLLSKTMLALVPKLVELCFFVDFSFGANFAIWCPKYAGVGHRIGRVMLFLIFRLAPILRFGVPEGSFLGAIFGVFSDSYF